MKEKVILVKKWNSTLQRYDQVEKRTGRYQFDDEDKRRIVSEYLSQGMSARDLVSKYHLSSRQVLFGWMDKYVHEEELVVLPDINPEDDMAKQLSKEDEIRLLKAENRRLQKALAFEKMRSTAFDKMIDVAESTMNIPIRKKSGTKQ